MKIIMTNNEAYAERIKREKAHIGCDKCPCCGETMTMREAIRQGYGLKKGISSCCISVPIKIGLFKIERRNITKYECRTCGAEWESENYL